MWEPQYLFALIPQQPWLASHKHHSRRVYSPGPAREEDEEEEEEEEELFGSPRHIIIIQRRMTTGSSARRASLETAGEAAALPAAESLPWN